MNEIVRRIVMMIGIVSIGTILIFFDASVIITISATLAFGVVMAMGLGLLKKEDFNKLTSFKKNSNKSTKLKKESKKQESKKDKKSIQIGKIFSQFHKTEQKDNLTSETKKPEKNGLSAGLSAALGSFSTTINKARDNSHSEKIDDLLNTTIDEPRLPSLITADNQPESSLLDDANELSDGIGFFDDEDFDGLDSLEIEGEEILFDFDQENRTEFNSEQKQDSETLNLNDEINSILLSENALDDNDNFSSEFLSDKISPELQTENANNQDICAEDDLFNSEEFFVQGIEDGLDEESFIHLPDTPTENQNTPSLIDSLNELNNITEFEKNNQGDSDFLDFDAINLDELETDDFSIETDEIIIEEEEINETDILPDDYIPSPDAGNTADLKSNNNVNDLFKGSGLSMPETDAPISFSKKNEYDDIMGALESDVKKSIKVSHTSLVRDMKDVNVEAKDLVSELETVLTAMGGTPRQTDSRNNRGEE